MNDRTICKRATVGMIVLIICTLTTGLCTDTALSPDKSPASAQNRILHFPQDQCMGRLSVEDPQLGSSYLELGRDLSLPLGLDPKRVALGGDSDFVAQAQGDVVVPTGRNIHLTTVLRPRQEDFTKLSQGSRAFLRNRFSSDPEELSGLGPNDLYELNVSSMLARADADQYILAPISRLTGLQVLKLNKTGITNEQMKYLKPLRALRALVLSGESSVGNAGIAALKDLPKLEYLDLDTRTTDAGFKHLGQLPSLRWLRIRTGRIYGPGLAELANLSRLERLCLWGTSPISDRHIKYLEGLTQLKSLTLWGRACNNLTDASLASIGKLKSLEELHFIRTSPRFTPAGVAHLKRLKNLKKVDFAQIWSGYSGEYYGDEVVRQLEALPNLESIKGINYLSAEGMKTMASFRNLKCLHFGLKKNKLGYGPAGLSRLAGLGSLEELFINNTSLSDTDISCLEPLSRLKKLHVGSTNFTDLSIASISKLDQLESLTLSVFGGSGVSKISKSGLNQLSSLTNLHTLDVTVHSTVIRPADGVTLDLSSLTNLNTLTLSGLSLHDADLESLAGLNHLEWLSLIGTFTHDGLRHLKNLHELKLLSMSGITCITGDRLSNLGGLKKLENLTLRGRITDAALSRLSGLGSIWSLRIETNEPIQPKTVAHLKQVMPMITYIHIDKSPRTMQPANRQSREQRERTRVSQPRINQRTLQNRWRRR